MSVSVPSMNSAMSRMSGPLSSLLGYEPHSGLMVGTSDSPRTSPHHGASWGCPPIQVKQEPADHDSSGVSSMASSMAHTSSSFLSGANTSPSSSSSAGSPPGHHGYHPSVPTQSGTHHGHHHDGLHHEGLSPRRASPVSPTSPVSSAGGSMVPMHSTPVTSHPAAATATTTTAAAGPTSPQRDTSAKVPRTPNGSVDDNSRSSTSSNSEDDAEEQVRRLCATLEAAKALNAAGSTPTQTLQCQLCNYIADCRERLSDHVAAHFRCSLCDHGAGSADGLRVHLQDCHDIHLPRGPPTVDGQTHDAGDDGYMDQDGEDDNQGDLESVATPRVNSQGKVKTFRCKQCDFVAVTKLDFWEHTKLHIKQEKMLCCPKCPFVTEYKHHLEYHLRNHFNSKPFKCDKCSYSCVNKSMLNSHLKSHSNVYQYRCADCTYATKYCHSLKLHLRKYGHQPSMVLNPDGTPNPLPIIDVYGTRRGPKTKTSKAAQQALQQQQQQQQQQLQHQQQFGMFPAPYGLPGIFPYAAPAPQDLPVVAPSGTPGAATAAVPRQGSPPVLLHRCNYCDLTTPDAEVLAQHMFVHAEAMQCNLMQYFSANNNNNYYQDKDYLGKALAQPVRQTTPPAVVAAAPATPQSPSRTPASPRAAPAAPSPPPAPVPAPGRLLGPLDLSKQEQPAGVEEVREAKSRRKGRAFKLERIAMRLQHQSSGDETEPEVVVKVVGADASTPEPKVRTTPPSSPPTSPAGPTGKEEYNCSYCDIAFRDIVMYTMHMGYHGYQDPFQCNMCGQQTTDKVAFFLHIARSSHS